jgi:tetratricopeptide (TPR) repeat protein
MNLSESTVSLCPARLNTVRELYHQGLMLQALKAGQDLGPLPTWAGTEARILAARLASQVGAPRLAAWLFRHAYRQEPDHPLARYFYGQNLFSRFGPYRTWQWMRDQPDLPEEAPKQTRAAWHALAGTILGTLRDLTGAEERLAQAMALAPESPWVWVCQAHVRESVDQYAEALAAARQALALRPWYRPAVAATAHLLTLLERDAEALALLREADQRLEVGSITAQLFSLQVELEHYADAARTLDRLEMLFPLAEKPVRKWLTGLRAEVAYYLGDVEASIRLAEQSDRPFWKAVAARLRQPPLAEGRSVTLPVGFVRQHQATCVPATLAALSRYWGHPVDHLEVAETICYVGTSAYHERKWASDHGWYAREFTVTIEAAIALLDRGIPFTLTVVEPSHAHSQAVIGYDGRRGTLLLRDPYWRNAREALADEFLERYRAFGPRGMVLLPQDQVQRLADVVLPEAEWWDRVHALDAALAAHRRDEAECIVRRLADEAGAHHRLTLEARLRLASYDENPTEQLAILDQFLTQFPDNLFLSLARLEVSRGQSRREERLATYRRLCAHADSAPIVWEQYAQELVEDARDHAEAMWLLRRTLRRWPTQAASYYTLGTLLKSQRRSDEALELFRFAACLADKEETFAEAYFQAAHAAKQTERGLTLLRDRFNRLGKKSGLPAQTLIRAYLRLDRTTDALATAEEALRMRPDDGELKLYVADLYAQLGPDRRPQAMALCEQARTCAPRGAWLRTAARLAEHEERWEEALALWREVLELQPLAIDAHQAVAWLLEQTEGAAAAQAHLAAAVARFPHHVPLSALWCQSVRAEPVEVCEAVVRRVMAANPDQAWVYCDLALVLAEQGKLDEAWQQVELASQRDPYDPTLVRVRAHLLALEGRSDQAQAELQRALERGTEEDETTKNLWFDLFDLHLAAGDLPHAEEALQAMGTHSPHPLVLARAAELAARRKDATQACDVLDRLCAVASEISWAWRTTIHSCLTLVPAGKVAAILQRRLCDPASAPAARPWWLDVPRALGLRWCMPRGRAAWQVPTRAAEAAVQAYLIALLETGHGWYLRWFLWANGDWLRTSDTLWATAGMMMSGLRKYRTVVRWMRDWRQRSHLEPWMLVGLVEALRATGRLAEARQASQAALALPSPTSKQVHRLWLAYDAVVSGQMLTAQEHLAHVHPNDLREEWSLLATCVRAVLQLEQAPPEQRAEVFAQVRQQIAQARRNAPGFGDEPAHRRAYRHCVGQIARRVRSLRGWLWWCWQVLWS